MCKDNTSMDILCATFIILISCGFREGKNPSLKWQILNPTIVFGEDVVLYCNASVVQNCCTNTATWMKDFDIIVHHGASIDTSKYIQKQRSDGFSLIITKFNEDDINHQYTCLYDFFSYSEVLKLNPDLMRYKPNKEEVKTNITMSDNLIVADVMFDMIYPSPECNFVVNGDMTVTNVTIFEETRNRLFYKIKLHLVCEIKKYNCIDSVAVNCAVGGDVMVFDKNNDLTCTECVGLNKCNVDKTEAIWIGSKEDLTTSFFFNEESTYKTTSFSIIVAAILSFGITVIISVIIWRKKKTKCRTTSLNLEDGDYQSTRSVMSCPVLCCRHPAILIVESEMIPLLQTNASSATVKSISSPAQKNRDVTEILRYVILNYKSYTQKISSDTRINAVRRSIHIRSFNPFLCWSVPSWASNIFNKDRLATNTEMNQVEGNRIVYRIILEVNAFLEDLTCIRLLKFALNYKTVGNVKPLSSSPVDLSLNDSKRRKRSPAHTAQKAKDVGRLINYATLHDRAYIQRLTTDIGINLARCRSNIDGLNAFTCLTLSVTRKGQRSTAWVVCPAQKGVFDILYYATLCDKTYIQRLVTNTRINIARQQRPVESKTPGSYQSYPPRSKLSTADAIKASSVYPSWGLRKRCRVRS